MVGGVAVEGRAFYNINCWYWERDHFIFYHPARLFDVQVNIAFKCQLRVHHSSMHGRFREWQVSELYSFCSLLPILLHLALVRNFSANTKCFTIAFVIISQINIQLRRMQFRSEVGSVGASFIWSNKNKDYIFLVQCLQLPAFLAIVKVCLFSCCLNLPCLI